MRVFAKDECDQKLHQEFESSSLRLKFARSFCPGCSGCFFACSVHFGAEFVEASAVSNSVFAVQSAIEAKTLGGAAPAIIFAGAI